METNGPVSADEASAALVAAKRTRPVVTAVLVFALFAGTGLTLSTRAARP